MAGRNRYVKVALFEEVKTNLMGGTVVGQFGDTILVQRPDAKPRGPKTVTRTRKAKTHAAPALTSPIQGVVNG